MLSADLSNGLARGAGQDPLSQLVFGGKKTLRDFLDALERAGDDPRVKGLYARLGDDALGLATCQEVRDAIRDFRAKGKFAIAFTDSFGEAGPGTPALLPRHRVRRDLAAAAGISSASSGCTATRRSFAARSTGSASSPASTIARNTRPR